MSRRVFRELLMFVGVVGGTAVGYSAGSSLVATHQVVTSFLGMALGGAFVHICLYRAE